MTEEKENKSAKLKKAIEGLRKVKDDLQWGRITYDDAKEKAQPHLDVLNERGAQIAKEHGQRYYPATFTGYMR